MRNKFWLNEGSDWIMSVEPKIKVGIEKLLGKMTVVYNIYLRN